MSNYNILQHSLYHIDLVENSVEFDNLDRGKAEQYVHSTINKSLNAEDTRLFKVSRTTTEVIALINSHIRQLINGYKSEIASTSEQSINNISKKIAERLLDSEVKAQKKILKMNKQIKRGSLIQAVIEENNIFSYILAKVEHINILDKLDWEKHTGLPLEKEVLKTCVIMYDDIGEIDEIKIFDTNKVISDYWSNGLLELEPLTTNEDNTLRSFNEINKVLVNNVRKKSPADYTLLYNSVLGYYNQNEGFDFGEFKQKVIDNYVSENLKPDDLKNLKNKLDKLSEKKFDRQFQITPGAIRNKKKRTYNINPDIELTIKDNIRNLKDVIKAEKGDNEDLFIKIKVNENIYKEFDFKDN